MEEEVGEKQRGGKKHGQKFGVCRLLMSARYTIRNLATYENRNHSRRIWGGR